MHRPEQTQRRYELTAYLGTDSAGMSWVLWECQVFDEEEALDFMSSGVRLFELASARGTLSRWRAITPAALPQYAVWGSIFRRSVDAART